MRRWFHRLALGTASVAAIAAHQSAKANPLGGRVTAGTATIAGENTARVTVNQFSPRAIIDWRSFNIAPGETTQFHQPNAAAIILNRVTGGLGVSTIHGMIKANGGVYVVNPDGFLFGPSAVINTGSFLATTHDIRNTDFMAGKYNFTIPGNPSASIINEGTITAATGGFATLVAPGVRNDGVISARLGTVALGAANGFSLDLYGDSLIKLQPSDVIAAQVKDAKTGKPLSSLVENTGKLKAHGGTVLLTAAAARQVVDSVINTKGVISANTVGTRNGRVIFGAATASTKPSGAGPQLVKVSGKINAAGRKPGTTGGLVQITGEHIQLSNATINASGDIGGGTILIGGDYHGGIPTPLMAQYGLSFQPWAVPNATTVSVDRVTTLNASAVTTGNGGKVVAWADHTTLFLGSILSAGGILSGNGGFVEVSGAQKLAFDGNIDTSAPKGLTGTVLFDPGQFYIVDDTFPERNFFNTNTVNAVLIDTGSSPAPTDSYIRASRINTLLLSSNVTLSNSFGDIFINAPLIHPANATSLIIINGTTTFNNVQYTANPGGDIYLNSYIDFTAVTAPSGYALGPIGLITAGSIIAAPGSYIALRSPYLDSGGVHIGSGSIVAGSSARLGSIGTAATPLTLVLPGFTPSFSNDPALRSCNAAGGCFFGAGFGFNFQFFGGPVSPSLNLANRHPSGTTLPVINGTTDYLAARGIFVSIVQTRPVGPIIPNPGPTTPPPQPTPPTVPPLPPIIPIAPVDPSPPSPPTNPSPTPPPRALTPQQENEILSAETGIAKSAHALFDPYTESPANVTATKSNELVGKPSFTRYVVSILDLILFAGLPPTNPSSAAGVVVGEGAKFLAGGNELPQYNFGTFGQIFDIYNNVDAYIPNCSTAAQCDTAIGPPRQNP